jgi:hypothetical protein
MSAEAATAPDLHVVEADPSDLSLDELAERIRIEFRQARRRSRTAVEAYLAAGRALAAARARFPSNREFGEWYRAQRFEFNRQRAWVLRSAAEREPDIRVLLASQLDNGREPNIEAAVNALHRSPNVEAALRLLRRPLLVGPATGPTAAGQEPSGSRRCDDTDHDHVPHPYGPGGRLCLTGDADPAERIAWADHIAAIAAAHREAERRRPPGDGQSHDVEPGSKARRPQWRKDEAHATRSEAWLRVELSWLRALRDDLAVLIPRRERELAELIAATPVDRLVKAAS